MLFEVKSFYYLDDSKEGKGRENGEGGKDSFPFPKLSFSSKNLNFLHFSYKKKKNIASAVFNFFTSGKFFFSPVIYL